MQAFALDVGIALDAGKRASEIVVYVIGIPFFYSNFLFTLRPTFIIT